MYQDFFGYIFNIFGYQIFLVNNINCIVYSFLKSFLCIYYVNFYL